MSLKQLGLELFKRIIWILDLVIPKKSSLFIYGCLSDRYYDNIRYLFEYAIEYQQDIQSVWLTRNKALCEKLNTKFGKETCKHIFSIRGLWTFLRAKVAFLSHGSIDYFYLLSSYSPKLIATPWHGQPLKTIGFASATKPRQMGERFDIFSVSSRVEKHAISYCFRHKVIEIIVTGLPRNDIYLENLKKNPEEEMQTFANKFSLEYIPKKVILYAPTYRPTHRTKFFPFKEMDWARLDKLMTKHQALLILRGHQNDFLTSKKKDQENSDQWKKNVLNKSWALVLHQSMLDDVTEILHIVSLLITDYSSIFWDFLLSDRPMMFIPYDLEEYEKTVGLMYPYDLVTPGPKVLTGNDFLKSLEAILEGRDYEVEKRKLIKNLFMETQEPKAREKIFEAIRKSL